MADKKNLASAAQEKTAGMFSMGAADQDKAEKNPTTKKTTTTKKATSKKTAEKPAAVKATKSKAEDKSQKVKTVPFAVRLPESPIAKIKAYAKSMSPSGYGDIGHIVDDIINDFVDNATMTKEQKAAFKKHFDYFNS